MLWAASECIPEHEQERVWAVWNLLMALHRLSALLAFVPWPPLLCSVPDWPADKHGHSEYQQSLAEQEEVVTGAQRVTFVQCETADSSWLRCAEGQTFAGVLRYGGNLSCSCA